MEAMWHRNAASCAMSSQPQASCSGRCLPAASPLPGRRRLVSRQANISTSLILTNSRISHGLASLRCIPPLTGTTTSNSRRLLLRVNSEQQRDFDRGPGGGTQRQIYNQPGGYDYAPPRSAPPRPPPSDGPPPTPPPPEGGSGGISNLTKAFVAGAFILGMGAGIWFDSEVTFAPTNVASTVLVDTKTPNSEVCMANGYSSMVFDQRIFVSFNPFNVYVAQPEVKPGCVLRRANFNVLESRNLVDNQQVQACKRNMNTFAFVGDLAGRPQVSCVYHSEEAENQFLKNPPKEVTAASAAAAAASGDAPSLQ